MSRGRVLHLLSQRPSLTGSGVTLDRLVAEAGRAGWQQHVMAGVPAGDAPTIGELPRECLDLVEFETPELPFPVPGMSDVMPYRSTVWSQMTDEQWRVYRAHWRRRLCEVVERFEPDVIHAHHVWLLGALVKDVCPRVRTVTHCHATGLRQLRTCPDRAAEVVAGVRRNEAFAALTPGMAAELAGALEIRASRIAVVGVGYRQELFRREERSPGTGRRLLYVGKLSRAKGLDCLLAAFARLSRSDPGYSLDIAGDGEGRESDELRAAIAALGDAVRLHGQLDQPQLADLMRRCDILVLPSFYEGLPLVLVEAVACGCRVVATDLPPVRETIAPALGECLVSIPLPVMARVDEPEPEARESFTEAVARAIAAATRATVAGTPDEGAAGAASGAAARSEARLASFTWSSVFERIQALWVPGDLAGRES